MQEKFSVDETGCLAELLVAGGVIAPPSSHISGGQYSWLTPPETPLAAMPGWLEGMIVGHLTGSQSESSKPDAGTDDTGFVAMAGSDAVRDMTFAELEDLPPGCRFDRVQQVVGSMLAHGFTEDEIISQGGE